jgi:hypothetical protein
VFRRADGRWSREVLNGLSVYKRLGFDTVAGAGRKAYVCLRLQSVSFGRKYRECGLEGLDQEIYMPRLEFNGNGLGGQDGLDGERYGGWEAEALVL